MNPGPIHPDRSLLLELPAPVRMIDGVLHVETQAHNGLQCWLANFERVTLCAPLVPGHAVDPTTTWKPATDLLADGRLRVHSLPWGYHPLEHLRHHRAVARMFSELVPKHGHLCFSNLGWLGNWGTVAAEQAKRQGRRYAVWLDWVLHDMPGPEGQSLARRIFGRLDHHLLKRKSLRAIRHASLGLFHGRSVFDAYQPYCIQPEVVHDIHLKPHDTIDEGALAARLARADGTLRIGYVGRVHPMKGPMQWIDAVERLVRCTGGQTRIDAVWVGDGPLLEQARATVVARGLGDVIRFAGAEHDRSRVLDFLRGLDLFVFCHLTPESPRCLIEALMAGVPLVGYDSPYARDLVATRGGGEYVETGQVDLLVERLAELVRQSSWRRNLSRQARASGLAFSDVAVFKHRSDLIKAYAA